MAAPRITLYGASSCPNCRKARQYLQQLGLCFQELDVNRSPRAQKALARLGARSVPVIMIGETRVDGFDRRQLDRALRSVTHR